MKAGRLTAEKLVALNLDKASDVYMCGPVGFMDDMKKALADEGFANGQVHAEIFGTGTMQ